MPRLNSRFGTVQRAGKLGALLLMTSFLIPVAPSSAQDMELRGTSASPRQQERQRGIPAPAYRPATSGADSESPPDANIAQGVDPLVDAALDSPPEPAPTRRRPAAVTEEREEGQAPNPRTGAVNPEEISRTNMREERTGAIERGTGSFDDEPFAAPGIRMGSFMLRPSFEQGLTATSNASGSAGGGSAVLSDTTLRLGAVSDWNRHSADITGYTTWRKSISGEHLDEVRGRIDATLNLDLDREWRAIARLGYESSPESASSPVAITGTASQPTRHRIDGSIGVEKSLGKLRLGLTGEVQRDLYEDAKLSSGGTLSQKHRDSTLYTARLRTGYEISPALTPFVQIEGGRRIYDERVDPGTYRRSADRIGASIGTEFDLGEKLGGEIAAGWLRESFDDDRLRALSAATLDATLRWSPQRGTNIGLRGTTTLEGSTTPGESGSVLYALRLTGDRQIRANLTANAALGIDWRDYSGSDERDLIYSAEAGLTWWMNRYMGLTVRARHETLDSNITGRDSKTNSVYLGITARR